MPLSLCFYSLIHAKARNQNNVQNEMGMANTYATSWECIDATFVEQRFDYIFPRVHGGDVKNVEIILRKWSITLFMTAISWRD